MKAWFKRLFRTKQNQAEPAVYFAHIPKTAGTSFIVLLDRFFNAEHIFPHQLWRENKEIDPSANQSYKLYRGHFGGGGVQVLTARPIENLTILRHPASLAHSTYQFVKREQNTKVHQLVQDADMSFADFLTHPSTAPLVQNRMIRNISFDFKEDPSAQEVFLSAETIEYLQSIINQQGPSIGDDERLERAKYFINKCRWFGLLERFDESLQLLCFVMNWPPVGSTQKLNTFKKNYQLTELEKASLEQVNQQDLALYEYACVQFDEKINAMKIKLEAFRSDSQQSLDDLLDFNYQSYQARHGQKTTGDFHYGFSQPLFGSQWHRREIMQPENEFFRWTGPGHQAFLDFWVTPEDYQLSIRIINTTDETVLDNIKITINDKTVPWQTQDQGVVRVLELVCPKELIQDNGLLRLGIECEQMISHSEAFDSDDERLVGIAVHWIKFKHAKAA